MNTETQNMNTESYAENTHPTLSRHTSSPKELQPNPRPLCLALTIPIHHLQRPGRNRSVKESGERLLEYGVSLSRDNKTDLLYIQESFAAEAETFKLGALSDSLFDFDDSVDGSKHHPAG